MRSVKWYISKAPLPFIFLSESFSYIVHGYHSEMLVETKEMWWHKLIQGIVQRRGQQRQPGSYMLFVPQDPSTLEYLKRRGILSSGVWLAKPLGDSLRNPWEPPWPQQRTAHPWR